MPMNRLLLMSSLLLLTGCLARAENRSIPRNNEGTGGASAGGAGGDSSCCIQGPAAPFEGPSWFAITGDGSPGTCPAPSVEGFEAHAEMEPLDPHTCGACSCSPAACTLPEDIHANAAKCAGAEGSIAVPFGPGPVWEGACSSEGALPAGLLCSGAPCAQSLTIPALPIAPCMPVAAPSPPFPAPSWARFAVQCELEALSGAECPAGSVCAPSPPDGLSLCVYAKGDVASCPTDYPARMVFYLGVDDQRGCSECQCSAQSGAQCMALVSAFSDSACSTLAGAVVVTDLEGACVDVVTGTALGSIDASMVTDKPGTCAQSGGAPFGTVTPAEPVTLCCQPNEPPG